MSQPIRWGAEAIWERVAPQLPGFSIEIVPTLDSSNTELMRRARAGHLEPVLLVAERQTAGRGRLGRQWQSTVGESLTFSLGLPLAPPDWSGLSLAVGLGLAQSLHPEIKLKWPNDLIWQGRKLAGILIETASFHDVRVAVIGVGLNLATPSANGLSTPPAGLRELEPGLDAPQLLARVTPPLVEAVLAFAETGFAPFCDAFNARDVLRGREVTLSGGLHGTARGVDASGALLVHTADGLQRVTTSEVSVRPVAPSEPP